MIASIRFTDLAPVAQLRTSTMDRRASRSREDRGREYKDFVTTEEAARHRASGYLAAHRHQLLSVQATAPGRAAHTPTPNFEPSSMTGSTSGRLLAKRSSRPNGDSAVAFKSSATPTLGSGSNQTNRSRRAAGALSPVGRCCGVPLFDRGRWRRVSEPREAARNRRLRVVHGSPAEQTTIDRGRAEDRRVPKPDRVLAPHRVICWARAVCLGAR